MLTIETARRQLVLPLGNSPGVAPMRLPSMKERIESGMQMLDSRLSGWQLNVDVETIDMRNPSECIGGQLRGHFLVFLCEFRIKLHEAVAMGFNILEPDGPDADLEYETLNRAWKLALGRR